MKNRKKAKNLAIEIIKIVSTFIAYSMLFIQYAKVKSDSLDKTDGIFLVLILVFLFSLWLSSIDDLVEAKNRWDFLCHLVCVCTGGVLIGVTTICALLLGYGIVEKIRSGLMLAIIIFTAIFILSSIRDLTVELLTKWYKLNRQQIK